MKEKDEWYICKPKMTVAQIRMSEDIKRQAEEVYAKLGLTFADAVRIFAVFSIQEGGFPNFYPEKKSAYGLLNKYAKNARNITKEQAIAECVTEDWQRQEAERLADEKAEEEKKK